MAISERSQTIIVWWSMVFLGIYGAAWVFLLHMLPPPPATLTAAEVGQWYQQRAGDIKLGAMVAGWSGGFMVPIWAVVTMQISRQETGRPIWSLMSAMGGTMMALFLVCCPVCWGVAAFAVDRAPEVTAVMHQLGVLALVTTDQFSPFCWTAVAVVCFIPQRAAHSPFPRWFGYFNIWVVLLLETGAVAFITRTGPFAWDGLLAFWLPTGLFGAWFFVMAYLLLKNLKLQRRDAEAGAPVEPVPLAI